MLESSSLLFKDVRPIIASFLKIQNDEILPAIQKYEVWLTNELRVFTSNFKTYTSSLTPPSSSGITTNISANRSARQNPNNVLCLACDYLCIRQTRKLSFYQASEAVLEMDPVSFYIVKHNRIDPSFLLYLRFFINILAELYKRTYIDNEHVERRIRDRFLSNIIRATKIIPKNDVRLLMPFLLMDRLKSSTTYSSALNGSMISTKQNHFDHS